MGKSHWPRSKCRGAVGLLIGAALAGGACSRTQSPGPTTENRISPKTGTSASTRVYTEGQQIPKGGGSYKIGSPYRIGTRWYVPAEDRAYDKVGLGSWYGSDFHGRKTANGEIFDMNALTAAHPTLPIPSFAYVTNLSNGRTILVRINDRGPYAHDRVIDLSRRSARELGYELQGVSQVRVKYAGPAPLNGSDVHEQRFLAAQNWHRGPAYASAPPAAVAPRYAPPALAPASAATYEPPPSRSAASAIPSGLTWRK